MLHTACEFMRQVARSRSGAKRPGGARGRLRALHDARGAEGRRAVGPQLPPERGLRLS